MPPVNRKPININGRNKKPMIFPLQPSNMSGGRAYNVKRRKSVNPGPLLLLLLVLFFIGLLGYLGFNRSAVAVEVNGDIVGYIKDVDTTQEEVNRLVLAKLKQEVGNTVELNDEITIRNVSSFFKKTENAEQVVARVCESVSYNQEAVSILVEGREFCIVATVEDARTALQTVLDNYKCPQGTGTPEFAIQINTGSSFVGNEQVSSVEEAIKLLSATQTVEKTHTVVQGETFTTIASNAGMTEAELLQANPSITPDTRTNIQVGQQIKITSTEPVLPIRTYSWVTTTEEVPYETVTQRNRNRSTSYREEIQEGVNGEKEVTKKIPYINGEQIGDPVVTEKITKEPVNRIIERGTREPDEDSSSNDDDDSSNE